MFRSMFYTVPFCWCHSWDWCRSDDLSRGLPGKSSESVQAAVLKACDACTDMASYSALYRFGRLSGYRLIINSVSRGPTIGPLFTETKFESWSMRCVGDSKAESRIYSSRCFEVRKLAFCLPKLHIKVGLRDTIVSLNPTVDIPL